MLAGVTQPTLADEIIAVLPALLTKFPSGPLAPAVASYIAADVPNVRRAFISLESDGRAKIVRRKRALHLVPPDHPIPVCIICRAEFKPAAKKTRTCSHSCARHLAWQNEDMRERHRASVIAARANPAERERQSKLHKERCADPAWRQKMSNQNRRSWKDPFSRAKRLSSIEAAWKGDRAKGRIEKARKKKLALWSDPDWKERTCEAMRTGKRGRFKRAVIALVAGSKTIESPEIACRVGLTVEQVKIIWRRAARLGEVERRPVDERRRRQSPELVQDRVAKTRARKMQRTTRSGGDGAYA